MVRAPKALREAASSYVAVLVTNMKDVDYTAIPFDFDLTMAVVLMNADGTIYHRYGSRPADNPTHWTSIDGLCRLLVRTLPEHLAHKPKATATRWQAGTKLPALANHLGNRPKPDCIHCHTIHDAQQHFARKQRTWSDEDRWVYPEPARVGLTMDAGDQARIASVEPGSPAANAGLRAEDRIIRLGRQASVLTVSDIMWALHGVPAGASSVIAEIQRSGATKRTTLKLAAGWKKIAASEYAWRPFKWGLSPAPGFGGPALGNSDKERLGLDAKTFAFRVQYLVTWGPKAHRGRAAAKAGIRKGDVITSFGGKNDFESGEHFHAWVRLNHRAGDEVAISLLRRGKRREIRYSLPR